MITLVNTFEVFGDDTARFERVFHETATFMSGREGFLGYRLVRSNRESKRYFNVAAWASMADLQAALAVPQMREHHELVSSLASVDPHPCSTVLEVQSDGQRVH